MQGVFHREDIGDIDLVWGNDRAGLQHIITKHINQQNDFNSINEMVDAIEQTLKDGALEQQKNGNYRVKTNNYTVAIAKDNNGNWVITAFDNTRKQVEKTDSSDTTRLHQSNTKGENGELVSPDESSAGKDNTKSLTERIKRGEILSQNAEETLVDLYSNMSKEDAQEVVNGIIKQTQDRQKQLAKKTINYEDIDKFQQHKKQVRETEKKLAYWNEVKSLFTAPLSQEEEVQSLKSIKEKEGALGQAYSIREYILRNLALGAKFLWNDSENGTKGLGSHLGLREAKEERRNYYAFLNGKDRKAVYPEVYAERLLTDVRENINPNVSFDEVFNEMIDCLSSYSTPTAMMDEAVRMHYEAEDNLTQNDFEKQQQAMIDRAEKREEDRIQDELNKQEALSEEDYERMRQGFDEQRTRPKQSDTVSNGNKRKPDSRTTDGGQSTDDGRRSEETSQRAGSANAERNNEEIKPIGKGVFGNIYDQFRGKVKEAVDFLLKHKEGDLLGVFHREEIGDIDLIWGSDSENQGLDHIIKKHINKLHDFKDVDEAVTIIEDVINNGEMKPIINNTEKVSFEKDGYKVSVKRKVRDNQGEVIGSKNWVVTAFDTTKTQRQKETETLSEKTLTTPPFNQKADGVTLPSNNVSVSAGKDTTVSENEQEKGEKNDKDTLKEDRSVKNITESESKRKGMLGVVLDALRKAIGKENVITDNRQAQRVIDEVNGRVRPEMTEDVFYSNAERSVENISQDKATPEQWLKMIEKQGGLKAGEDKWLGLSDWLKDSKEKTLTKQDVLDFIRSNKIQIEEVEYGDAFFSPNSKINFENDIARARENGESYESVIEAWDEKYDTMLRYAYRHGFFTVDENGKVITNTPILQPINGTRRNYTTAFLKKKKEIAIVVPNIESWNEGDEIHFGDAGNGRAVAWIRFGETTDKDGDRVLVIDEIQSKRHQEGREKGYKGFELTKIEQERTKALKDQGAYIRKLAEKYGAFQGDRAFPLEHWTKEEKEKFNALQAEINKANDSLDNYEKENGYSYNKVPDAPFEKNWHELAMKRMLRYAAENGYDKVAWTTGEQQAERYNIGNVVESIIYYDYPARKDKEGRNTKKIVIRSHNNEPMSMRVNNEGLIIDAGSELRGKNLMEVLGKELAAKILNGDGSDITLWDESMDNPAKEINGNGLRIGGEGMKGFYDQMLPRFMDKYGKKWGVKTQDVELPEVEEAGRIMHSVDVTDEMRRSVMEGQPLFQRESSEESKERAERVKNDLDLRRELKEITGAEGYGTNTAYVRGTSQDGTTYEVRVGNHIANFENFDRNNEELPQKIVSVVVMDEKFDKKTARYKSSGAINRELDEKDIDCEFQQIIIDDVKNKSQEEIQQAIEDVLFGMQVLKERGRLLFDSESAISYSKVQKRKYLSNRIEDIFNDVIKGKLKGQPVRIGNLSQEGKRHLEEISGLKLKENCHFVLNPSDLQHIYNNHFGDNEKDKGNNVPLTMHDIKRIADVISFPTEIVYGKDTDGLNKFFFLMESPSGTYNLLEIYANRNGNLTAKSYYKTKKSVSQRVISLRNSLHSTSSTDGATLSSAKIPQIFELPNENNLKLHKVYHGSGADFEAFDHSHMGEGEGNQAYGWGTYVTEAEGIGRTYADTVLNRDNPYKVVKYIGDNPKYADEIAPLFKNGVRTYEEVKDFIAKSSNPRKDEHLQWFLSTRPEQWQSPNAGKRHLYTVEIPKDNGKNYLDWDGYVSNEQYPMWYEAMKILGEQDGFAKPEEVLPFKKGHTRVSIEHEVKYLGHKHTPKAVSEALNKAGFTGIKYPAQYRTGGRKDGAKNYVIFDEKDLEITDKVKFFKTKEGEAYGFTVGGKVYVDERIADASTPIHEYTHLWAEALRKVNPKEWQNIVSLMKKQTYLWDKVKNDYPELKTDDEIADEVLAHYSGERGKKLLDEEYDKIRGNNKMNIFDKAKMLQAINNVREALRKFWKGVADFLGIHFTSAEEVADKVLSDLLEGVNPNEVKSAADNVGTFDSENADIRFHKSTERVVEKATDKALEIASKHI